MKYQTILSDIERVTQNEGTTELLPRKQDDVHARRKYYHNYLIRLSSSLSDEKRCNATSIIERLTNLSKTFLLLKL